MKVIQRNNAIKLMKKYYFRQIFFIGSLLFIIAGSIYGATDSRYLPFNRDNTTLLLQKTVEARLIPFVIEDDGMKLTISKLLVFAMDWATARFTLSCAFTAEYQGFININESGEFSLRGCGLLSPGEQKLGVKLLEIEALKLEHYGSIISEAARVLLNRNLSGIEFWQGGGNPASSVVLNKDNFTMLLRVALNQQLPLTASDDTFNITLLQLGDLTLTDESGELLARFMLKGTYKKLITMPFEGEAVIGVNVSVDPDALEGLIRIEEVTDLDFKGIPGFLDGIIRGLINTKLKGKETPFIWR